MKSLIHITVAISICLATSCVSSYEKAKISKISADGGAENAEKRSLVYQYRIGGLQQMFIYVHPEEKFFSLHKQRSRFTQEELSKLKIKVVSLSGAMSVNGLEIDRGKTFVVDLKKIYEADGRGWIENDGKYISMLRFVSEKKVSASENLCDFMLTIEDPEGVTRSTGLRVHGGFTVSL